MDPKHAGSALDDLVSSFTIRIAELQELVIARNMYPATTIPDLSAVDATLKAMESQIEAIKGRLQEEKNAIPKAKRLVEQSQRQQRKLQHMLAHVPAAMVESLTLVDRNPSSAILEVSDCDVAYEASKQREEPVAAPKKGRGSAPRWYISAVELDSLSSYMRGRLTLEKVNIAINEVATYADANAHLISCPKKKLAEDAWGKALELRDIAMAEPVKGKHFFLEADIKGPGLKLDNTGKAILTVLRHLGRIQETRIGHHRVLILSKPH
ncbi:spindle and kinetochore-associated protein 1 homolog [Ananas comosus]|uniref:SKA complex subunit 1 homolog n=1 Tax=Ananas comosus TaxID=4615 RepID=A0A6P5FHS2_ANACO|nr:spindle and kinetochore-associated protein 1 homolog [Ananas comosus]XP_020095453.1 spindle and kinetochore-associated protein 1 homolog [Ananas comosus]XP_020095454.1 spindle and kinetochore-associated protein 1 homolog [Ananas comosus]